MIRLYDVAETEDGLYAYTFYGTPFSDLNGLRIVSDAEWLYDNPMMILLELQYDKEMGGLWRPINNKHNWQLLEDHYLKDKTTFEETFSRISEEIIKEYEREIKFQQDMLAYYIGENKCQY